VNIVERLVVLNGGDTLDAGAVRRCLPELTAGQPVVITNQPPATDPSLTLDEVERRHVLGTLDRHAGNKQAAADALGISRRSLFDRLARWRGEAPPIDDV